MLAFAWDIHTKRVVAFGALVGAGAVIWSKFLQPLVEFAVRFVKLAAVVEHEFKPDGGLSMRDAIDRVEKSQGVTNVRLDGVERQQKSTNDRLDALELYATTPARRPL